ncbi:hypothetical protein AAG906_034749 [Vitis piasezkii]
MQMVVAHCGRCGERVVFGDEITDGGRDDLEKITIHNFVDDLIWFICLSNPSCYLFVQIARYMVISPANSRLGLTALTKQVGLMDRPDSPDGDLIKYSIIFSISLFCIISSIHICVCSI